MLGSVSYAAPSDIVLVHGAGGNGLLWRRTVLGLSGPAKALAVDLPGHPGGDISCHTIGDYAEAVHEFARQAGLDRPVFCGHSMGGAIVMALALSHPDYIGGLVLVSTGAKLGVSQEIIDGLKTRPMRAIEEIITPRSFSSMDLGLGREARTALSISNLPVFLNDYLACEGFDVRKELTRITTKTLVVCGDKDRMTPPKWSHYLHANITDSDLLFVKDSGHMVPLEKPDVLSKVIQAYLGSFTR